MAPPNRKIRGIRTSVPQGFILGRVDPGEGDVQLLGLQELLSLGLAPAATAGGGGGGGTGDVVGPASAVDDRVATFDGTTGKLIQDGGMTIAQIIAAGGGGGGGRPPEGSYEKPLIAGLTWVNQGGATATDGTESLIVIAPDVGFNDQRLLVKTPPSAPYSVYSRFDPFLHTDSNSAAGIVFRNSTTGVFLTFWNQFGGNVIVNRWSGINAFDSTSFNIVMGMRMPTWLRADVTSTTITWFIGYDGLDWIPVGTAETLSSFLTFGSGALDQVGLVLNPKGGAEAFFRSFGFTTPTP